MVILVVQRRLRCGIGIAADYCADTAGEPNFDSRVADPFQSKKARREQEVAHLLDKLQPSMIVLDPSEIVQVCFLDGSLTTALLMPADVHP